MVLSFSGCFVWLAGSLATVTATLDKGDPGGGYVHTRRYQSGSLTVLISIVFWVTDNMGCAASARIAKATLFRARRTTNRRRIMATGNPVSAFDFI